MRTVFLLENDPDILFVLEWWLKKENFEVCSFLKPGDLLQSLPGLVPHLIMLDYHTLLISGDSNLCRDLKIIHNYHNPLILLSSFPLPPANPLLSFVDQVISKPFDLQDVSRIINATLDIG